MPFDCSELDSVAQASTRVSRARPGAPRRRARLRGIWSEVGCARNWRS